MREKASLTDEEQLPRGCIHGARIGIEQAPRFRSREIVDIDAMRSTRHVINKVMTIRKKLRKPVTPLLSL